MVQTRPSDANFVFKLADVEDALFTDWVIAQKFGLRLPSLHKHCSPNFIVTL